MKNLHIIFRLQPFPWQYSQAVKEMKRGYDDNDIDAFKESPEEKLEKSDMQDHDQHMQDTSHMHMDHVHESKHVNRASLSIWYLGSAVTEC